MLLSMVPFLHLFAAFYYWMEVILALHTMEFWTSTFLCYIYRVNITFFQCIY